MKVLLTIISLLLFTGCNLSIFNYTEVEYDNVMITVTKLKFVDSSNVFSYPWCSFLASGTVVNIGEDTLFKNQYMLDPTWFVEGTFYTDSTFTQSIGTSRDMMGVDLTPGDTTTWSMSITDSTVCTLDYPNFTVNNLKVYIEN